MLITVTISRNNDPDSTRNGNPLFFLSTVSEETIIVLCKIKMKNEVLTENL